MIVVNTWEIPEKLDPYNPIGRGWGERISEFMSEYAHVISSATGKVVLSASEPQNDFFQIYASDGTVIATFDSLTKRLRLTNTSSGKIVVTDVNNNVVSSDLDSSTLVYLSGVDSNIQSQIDSKLDVSTSADFALVNHTHTQAQITSASGWITSAFTEASEIFGGNGVRSGMLISVGSPTSTFSISSGVYHTIDGTNVNYNGVTNVPVTDIATQASTNLAIDISDNSVVQQSGEFTPEQRRTHVIIGKVIHTNNTSINAVNNQPDVASYTLAQLNDLMDSFGAFNINGNIISANGANLSINKSSGLLYQKGINFDIDGANNPHVKTMDPLVAPTTLRMRMSNSVESANTNVIDLQYESSTGELTPLSSGKFATFRVVLFPSNLIRIQYPQFVYNSMDDAQEGINTENYITELNMAENGLTRAFIIIRGGTTALNNTNDVEFVQADKFGYHIAGGGGGSTTTLQNAYDNSVEPEIITNSTLGAVSIQRGSTADTDHVFEIKNGAGDITAYITGNGEGTFATSADLNAHVTSASIHFTEASIEHGNILGLLDNDHPQYALSADFNSHIIDLDIHRPVNDSDTTTQNIWSAQKVQDELDTKSDTTHTHTLDYLSDVNISVPLDGQVLVYSSATSDWINGAGGGSPTEGTASGGAGTLQTTHISNAHGLIDFGEGTTQYPRYSYISPTNDVKSVDTLRFYVYSIDSTISFDFAIMKQNGSDWDRLTSNTVSVSATGFHDVTLNDINMVAGDNYAFGMVRQSTTGSCQIAFAPSLSTADIGFIGGALTGTIEIPSTESTKTSTNVVPWIMAYSSGGGDFNSWSTTTKTTNYTAVRNNVILCDTSSGSFNVTLPLASGNKDKTIMIKKITNDAGVVNVITQGSDTIDNTTNKIIGYYLTSFTVISDGVKWWVV